MLRAPIFACGIDVNPIYFTDRPQFVVVIFFLFLCSVSRFLWHSVGIGTEDNSLQSSLLFNIELRQSVTLPGKNGHGQQCCISGASLYHMKYGLRLICVSCAVCHISREGWYCIGNVNPQCHRLVHSRVKIGVNTSPYRKL